MKEESFDSKIRKLVESCSETPEPEVWDRIEAGLDRGRRRTVWRTASRFCAAAAVAAGLFAAALMFRGGQEALPELTAEAGTAEPAAEISRVRTVPLEPLPPAPAVHVETGTSDMPLIKTDLRRSMTSGTVSESPEQEQTGLRPSGLPSIYDQTASMEYIAMAAEGGGHTASTGRKGSFSLSASGSLSTSRASGNVDFSQPGYSSGTSAQTFSQSFVPVSEPRHYFPVSVGIEARYSFLNDRLGVGLGLNYTFLNSRYEALVDRQYQVSVDQSVHYLGIPLTFYVNIISGDRLFFYADAGCMMERAVKITYEMTDLSSVPYQKDGQASGLQWSANVGIGLEYRFLDFMGVYVDPRLTYFFDCDQPYSVRSEQPLQFNLQMGFRFHIGV